MDNNYDFSENYQSHTNKRESRKVNLAVTIIAVVLSAVIGALSGVGSVLLAQKFDDNGIGSSSKQPTTQKVEEITLDVENVDATIVEAVAQKVTPSVVGIRTTVSTLGYFGTSQQTSGEGSGVIYTDDGYIITNYHVISSAVEQKDGSIQVFLSSDSEKAYDATVVGYNISCDLAVIKIEANNLNKVDWADSSKLKGGQYVVAIGNPGGLEFMGSVTFGVISGLDRIIADGYDSSSVSLIQTDAAINPGNSGGALVNIKGELVGINSSKIVSDGYEGMGFAIPSNDVKEIVDRIISRENEPSAYLGITLADVEPALLESNGYPAGAMIYSVVPSGPADQAGLKRYDVITEFGGVAISHYNALIDAIADTKPGTQVTVKFYRASQYYTVKVTLGSNG